MSKQVAIIGGGAAGFFAAVNLAERSAGHHIAIYEASSKLMSKILVSGGGRCNVTNTITDPEHLASHYPRGHSDLASVFGRFGSRETHQWFEDHGVKLHTEEDGRMFPVTNSSRTIYDCLHDRATTLNVGIKTKHRLTGLKPAEGRWKLEFGDHNEEVDALILTPGSSNAIWNMLEGLGHRIIPPVPSLFTLKCEPDGLEKLSGIALPNVRLSMDAGHWEGPLLLTHVGLSGPAALKLSAWKARELAQSSYQANIQICWNSDWTAEELHQMMLSRAEEQPKERLSQWKELGLPKRLWAHILDAADIPEFCNWSELGKKRRQKLVTLLVSYGVKTTGKNTFKEEFVTAGGVPLEELDLERFESKLHPGLYMAGEVLNIDAVTGGFNFQAAWSAAYLISTVV